VQSENPGAVVDACTSTDQRNPPPAPVVRLAGVYRTYHRATAPVRALRGTSLVVEKGTFTAIMGPSGCGKSTLLNVIAGIDTPDEGSVEVAGAMVSALSDDERAMVRRDRVGMVFQFFNLIDDMTALDNVRLAAGLRQDARTARRRALATLDLVGMGHDADTVVGLLSGGQRQRVAIARALVNDPAIVLADEPTGALDTASAQEFLELFRRIGTGGQSILMATHDPQVADWADVVHRMDDGVLSGQARA
jgi:putative ABC transport system ATP-binding protein